MKGIFGEPEPLALVPSIQIQHTASREETHQDPGAVIGNILLSARPPAKASALAAIKNRPNLSFPKSEQTLRLKGIALWCEIIWSDPQKFGITRHIQISEAAKNPEAAEDLLTCVDAVMGVKASSTINSRGMVVKRYQFWCTEHNEIAWPMQETVAFDYVSHLKTLGAATAPASFPTGGKLHDLYH